MVKEPIGKLESDVKAFDLIALEVPSTVYTCVSHSGNDYLVGFYECVDDGNVRMSWSQKHAYARPESLVVPMQDIESYEILKRFTPDRNDGIDYLLCDMFDIEMPDDETP